jgi:hypothetical protein
MRTHTATEVVLLKEANGKSRLVDSHPFKTPLFLGAGCQVSGTIDDDGNWVGEPSCTSSGCAGACQLNQETSGSHTRYWCECT